MVRGDSYSIGLIPGSFREGMHSAIPIHRQRNLYTRDEITLIIYLYQRPLDGYPIPALQFVSLFYDKRNNLMQYRI